MKIALVNGSPKMSHSASGCLLDHLEALLDNENHEITKHSLRRPKLHQQVAQDLSTCDALVLAFPLYVDGIPSHFLSCLMQLDECLAQTEKEILVYAIVNCGFYEGEQARWALAILENWCQRAKVRWGHGIGLGAGGMIPSTANIPLDAGPNKNLDKALKRLARNILQRASDQNLYTTANIPKLAYKLAAEMGWRRSAKLNGLKRHDLSLRR